MLVAIAALALLPKDPLAEGFLNPPAWARPHTWWHWMDGNVTKEGIAADLKAMKEVGIGGAQMFTVSQNIPPGPVGYMSPKWLEMTGYAVQEAAKQGIELCVHNCAGWSSSGGPWVKPEDAMQVIAWSHLDVQGPTNFSGKLPQAKAPQVYANVPYYKDIAVYAVPTQPAQPAPKDFLGRTGVVRQDGLVPDISQESGVKPIDITGYLMSDGTLSWQVPAGSWTILRMGHVPTGKDNHPAPPEGDGLEVDKLSREALDHFWAGGMAKIIKAAGPLAGKVLNNALVDSYEVGSQNWTPKMREQFTRLRGYDPMPWLPALAGVEVESKEKTERFLWDYRRTIADLYAENYYGHFAELCHQNGLKFSTEPYGNGGFDTITAGSKADILMGEFWLGGGAMETTKLASSIAHVYGRKIVGAESFTADEGRGRWIEEPYLMKTVGDLAFANGVNRYIFHRYAMQPWMALRPGMTMGPWGTHLERTNTWWKEAAEWMKYNSRCQYLLQSGKSEADIAYYIGENSPADLPPPGSLHLPEGYDYDGIDTQALLSLTVRDGRVVAPSGASYALLVLPQQPFMTVRVARKVRELVRDGALVYGGKPTQSPSLAEIGAGDEEVRQIAEEVWESEDIHHYGKGIMAADANLRELLAMRTTPDLEYSPRDYTTQLVWIHRNVGGADAYFVSNQKYTSVSPLCSFRGEGRAPELWNPVTGEIKPTPFLQRDGRTLVTLSLQPAESVFVVFRGTSAGRHLDTFKLIEPPVLGTRPPVITIERARYESADGRGVDVTDKVRELVKSHQYEIPASNELFGDPVVNVVKRLVVEYRINGNVKKQIVAENDTLVILPMPKSKALAPAYELTDRRDGSAELVVWKPSMFGYGVGGAMKTMTVNRGASKLDMDSAWRVSFPPNLGAPPTANFEKLASWTESTDRGIRNFSGTATYSKRLDVPTGFLSNRQVRLDLGTVKNFATVYVNGRKLATLWRPPFVVDVTGALKPGRNELRIDVTNLWPNRLIGDEQLPPDVEWEGNHLKRWPDWLVKGQPRPKTGRISFTTWRYYTKDSPLLESGLLGPVVLQSAASQVIRY